MVLHRPATWVDPVLNVVAGRTATSWAICVTLTADLSGPVAALHNSTISSSQSKYFISSRFWVLIFNQLFHCSGETATCLFNSPHEDAVLPRVLPGKLLSLDAQCRMDRGTSACFVSAKWYFFLHTKCQSFKPFAFFFPFFFKTAERWSRVRPIVLLRRLLWLLRLLPTGSWRFHLWRWPGKYCFLA